MLKTLEFENEIQQFQNGFKTGDSYFTKYGSFFRKDKKYVNDVDIYQIYKNHISFNTQNIIFTIESIVKRPNIHEITILFGHNDYYYKKPDLKLMKEMLKNNDITKKKYEELKYLIELNADHKTIKKHLSVPTYLNWDIEDIRKGYIIEYDKKYNFRDISKQNSKIVIRFLYKYKNYYVNIEYTITSDHDFNKKKNKDDKKSIYNGCKLPQYAFLLKKYYNTIKRLKSCYAVNIRDQLYKSLNEKDKEYLYNAYKNIEKILKDKELFISQYHLDIASASISKDDKTKDKKKKLFNETFKKIATEHYYKGVEHHLIY